MNACDHGPLSIELTVAQRDPGLRDPDAFPVFLTQRRDDVSIPHGLVVCRDQSICGALTGVLVHCGVAPVFASTVREAALDIAKRDRSFALCQDALRDGSYEDLLRIRDAFGSSLPLIVISRTGEWPDYFRAIDQGAYDFLAYPLIPGELQRIIRNLLGDPYLRLRASPLLRLFG